MTRLKRPSHRPHIPGPAWKLFSDLRARWRSSRVLTRHWIINFLIGSAVEFILILLHHLSPGLLAPVDNWALDRMTVIHALIDPAPPGGRAPPRQIFVNVDDVTWRSRDWGGGEPGRAPREALLKLIQTSFSHGATQVVLDILVEGHTTYAEEQQEDRRFAEGLKLLLESKTFNAGDRKQLVLVRSLRRPLPQAAFDEGNTLASQTYPALSELRESSRLDEVVKDSAGRIVVAAPYFVYSPDRVLRDWQLFKVVCLRAEGTMHVVPSVQLLVTAKYLGVSLDKMPKQPANPCRPFPQQALAVPPMASALSHQQERIDQQEHDVSVRYWTELRAAVHGATRNGQNMGLDIGTAAFHAGDLSNRIVYRSGASQQPDRYFSEVQAHQLLNGDLDDNRLSSLFSGRVAVIGQSFLEAGDRHYTPLGQMPGAVVLLNAIDSMVRFPLIQRPSAWITTPIALLLIVLVGYVFARWDSTLGPLISTALALPILAIASFYLFRYGVWLDFALPVLAILIHREIKSFEERIELRKLAHQAGTYHEH
jgi:CHASE2 domain-containing sensor protein